AAEVGLVCVKVAMGDLVVAKFAGKRAGLGKSTVLRRSYRVNSTFPGNFPAMGRHLALNSNVNKALRRRDIQRRDKISGSASDETAYNYLHRIDTKFVFPTGLLPGSQRYAQAALKPYPFVRRSLTHRKTRFVNGAVAALLGVIFSVLLSPTAF